MKTLKQVKKEAAELGIKINGCGPQGWKEKVVPDRAWWLFFASIKVSCAIHDLAYGIGGKELDRTSADANFGIDIFEELKSNWLVKSMWWRPSVRWRVEKTADLYYHFVKEYGSGSFNYKDN